MSVQSHVDFFNHKQVCFFNDEETGLKAIVAIHNTQLGPALGGCRMWPYASEDEALTDVLRLSKGMTYKAAAANLALGGGKSVIIGDPKKDKSEGLLRAMGRYLNQLDGEYILAEDSGISVEDVRIMSQETVHVSGVNDRLNIEGKIKNGDPSPATAYGTYIGLCTAVKHKFGESNLCGLKIAIQGVGNVGYFLAEHLYEAGADLYVSDVDEDRLARAKRNFKATLIHPEEIMALDVDVFSPCALGASINDQSIDSLQAKVIAGAANNQLHRAIHGDELKARDILYSPDFVINAGGVIDIALERNGANAKAIQKKLMAIGNTLEKIFHISDKDNIPTAKVAEKLAENIFLKR